MKKIWQKNEQGEVFFDYYLHPECDQLYECSMFGKCGYVHCTVRFKSKKELKDKQRCDVNGNSCICFYS